MIANKIKRHNHFILFHLKKRKENSACCTSTVEIDTWHSVVILTVLLTLNPVNCSVSSNGSMPILCHSLSSKMMRKVLHLRDKFHSELQSWGSCLSEYYCSQISFEGTETQEWAPPADSLRWRADMRMRCGSRREGGRRGQITGQRLTTQG